MPPDHPSATHDAGGTSSGSMASGIDAGGAGSEMRYAIDDGRRVASLRRLEIDTIKRLHDELRRKYSDRDRNMDGSK